MSGEISHIGIVGAGNMGSGIAQKYASHGFKVTVVDQNADNLQKSKNTIDKTLNEAVARGIFSDSEARGIANNLNFTRNLAEVGTASLVIEAIFEDLSSKRQLFQQLETICPKDAILATNTSSFKVGDLLADLIYQHRVLGLHYFFPPAKNRLVEIIATPHTGQDKILEVSRIQERIKKTAIHSKDSPGFIVNRFFVPWLNEAMRIVFEHEANIATVEAAAKDFFGIGMGPFQLMNVTGMPITYHSCVSLAASLGEFYAPCPLIVNQIEQQKPWDLIGIVDSRKIDEIATRLLLVVSGISSQMVHSEHVCSESDADLGANVGLIWPKGPFELLKEHRERIIGGLNTIKLGYSWEHIAAALRKRL